MFSERKTKKKLENDFISILPTKEKVLPEHSIVPKKKASIMRRIAVVASCIFILGLSVTIILSGVIPYLTNSGYIDASAISEMTSDIASNDSSINPPEKKKIVISAGCLDSNPKINEEIPSSKKIYISDMLKEKMQQYRGEDVLFKVMVALPTTEEEYQNFQDNILYKSDDFATEANTIISLKKELEEYSEYLELYAKYYEYIIAVKEGDIQLSDEYYDIKKEYEKIKPYHDEAIEIYKNINDIENDSIEKYIKILKEEKIEYAKTLGATNIRPVVETSEIRCIDEYVKYMNLSEDMINKMAERGGYMFKLALPDRVEGYSRKITDYLSVLLEQAEDDEEIHIAVVSVMDKTNEFVSSRQIPCNPEYNSDLNKEWFFEGDPKVEDVKDYLKKILDRNNISDKRIINKNKSDIWISYCDQRTKSIIKAGFEVKLTKFQIVELAKDPDVKVIYPMNNKLYDNYLDMHDD